MSIEIKYVTLGLAQTNAYLVADDTTKAAILIDPVDEPETLKQMADDSGWAIKLILATHAHFDHILASKRLKELTGAPFYIHAEAVPMLQALPQQGLRFIGQLYPEAAEPDRLLTSESETISVGAITLETLYTPGHAPGHLAFYMREQGVVFSGDALFAGSVGRTDLPGGSWQVLEASIRGKLFTLPGDTKVLPGHGGMTTIDTERRTNPFLS
jgi:hydroxyacylglutathione hydrolase